MGCNQKENLYIYYSIQIHIHTRGKVAVTGTHDAECGKVGFNK